MYLGRKISVAIPSPAAGAALSEQIPVFSITDLIEADLHYILSNICKYI